MMEVRAVSLVLAVLALGLPIPGNGAEILNSYANDRETFDASTSTTSAVTVKCLSVNGAARNGITPRCYIASPGYNRLLPIGHSIGTTGPGTVSLACVGTRPPRQTLSCSAEVGRACQSSKAVTAYLENGGTYPETAPISTSSATVHCTSAVGASSGAARCYVTSPTFSGAISAGQSVSVGGPGTVIFSCTGNYRNRLSCRGTVTQVCR